MRPSIVLVVLCAACASPDWRAPSSDDAAATRDEVLAMLDDVARDLAADGPLAWLEHFALDDFFMVSDGVVQFRDRAEAESFLRDFAPNVTGMRLRWIEPRVVVLSRGLATVLAGFDEDITLADGMVERFAGEFTADARLGRDGWRLGHGHWSSRTPGADEVP